MQHGAIADVDPPSSGSGSVPDNSIPTGTVIDERFRVRSVLGSGATATVYEALDLTLDRSVALKVPRPNLSEDVHARFVREAEIVARIDSPHVPRLFGMGRFENGLPYLILERLTGASLAEYIGSGVVPIPLALEIACQLCRALSHVHREGAIHRDVKPENIVLHETGEEGFTVRLLDFGVSRDLSGDTPTLTAEGALIGTPYYMAPEQVRGLPVGSRTDVYAVGAVLFEMLTGRPPFVGETLVEVAASILRDELPDIRELRPDVSHQLAAAIGSALAKDCNDRCHSAEELEAALLGVATDESITLGRQLFHLTRTSQPPVAEPAQSGERPRHRVRVPNSTLPFDPKPSPWAWPLAAAALTLLGIAAAFTFEDATPDPIANDAPPIADDSTPARENGRASFVEASPLGAIRTSIEPLTSIAPVAVEPVRERTVNDEPRADPRPRASSQEGRDEPRASQREDHPRDESWLLPTELVDPVLAAEAPPVANNEADAEVTPAPHATTSAVPGLPSNPYTAEPSPY